MVAPIFSCGLCGLPMPRCNHQEAPLKQDALQFMQLLRKQLGQCSISGGSAVAQQQHQVQCCDNCCARSQHADKDSQPFADVDFFVPAIPFIEGINLPVVNSLSSWNLVRDMVLPAFNFSNAGNQRGPLVPVKDGKEVALHGNMEEIFSQEELEKCLRTLRAGMARTRRIIWRIVDFQCRSMVGSKEPGSTFQTVFMASTPPEHQSWADFVTSSFDTDIVKNSVELISSGAHPDIWMPKIIFVDQSAFHSFVQKCFVCTVQANSLLDPCMKRVKKYLNKGCNLSLVLFEDSISLPLRWFWMGCFQSRHGKIACQSVTSPERIMGGMIGQFAGKKCPPPAKWQLSFPTFPCPLLSMTQMIS